jgi:CubicO group peptidase (beta-lactamase class C family)
VLLSQGYGLADREQKIPNDPKTRFRIGSLTKQFTAMAILILQSQDKLGVQDLICNYIAECPAKWDAITIDQLLTHTSGIADILTMSDYNQTKATPISPKQLIERVKSLPMDFQPGEQFSYSNSGYILLGYIIEQTSGKSYEAFLQQSIFTPLKMNDTGVDHNTNGVAVGYADQYSTESADFVDASTEHGAGALYSTVEDLFLWDRALYTEQLVPRVQLDQMFAPHVTIPNRGGAAYGYGWRVWNEGERPAIEHTGMIYGFVSIITRYPEDQIVIILLSNQQDNGVDKIRESISTRLFGED